MTQQLVPPRILVSNSEAVFCVPPLGPSAGGAEGVFPLETRVTSPIWREPQGPTGGGAFSWLMADSMKVSIGPCGFCRNNFILVTPILLISPPKTVGEVREDENYYILIKVYMLDIKREIYSLRKSQPNNNSWKNIVTVFHVVETRKKSILFKLTEEYFHLNVTPL